MVMAFGAGGNALRPAFQLSFNDSGAGAVSTVEDMGNVSATFTRATTAWTKLSTNLWASVASGTARSFYTGLNTAAGTYAGYLAEGARTNEVLWSRDMTNAAWTKVTTTAAADQTGIDGVANSASSLTATAGNGTTLQVITEAAATRVFSAFIKRITGTGEIDMTEDGGATWTDVTASINSSTFTQVNAASQSVLNPSVGFRIVTSGDAIAVDMAQNEAGSFASTPIPTTTVAVARNADVLTYPTTGWFNETAGTFFGNVYPHAPDAFVTAQALFQAHDGTNNNRHNMNRSGNLSGATVNGGVVQANIDSGVAMSQNTSAKAAYGYAANDFAVTLNGSIPVADTSGTVPSGLTTFAIGDTITETNLFWGALRRVTYYNTRLANTYLVNLTA